MNIMQIDIFGSCVTRDAFAITNNNYHMGSYFSRSSISSIYSRKIAINTSDVQLTSKFQKRMVYFDLVKRFRSYIKESDADYLIIDLIDERFKIGKVKNSYVTISTDFLNSNLNLEFKKLSNDNKNLIWFDKAKDFIEDLRIFGVEKVILHKAFWKETYIDKDGNICTFENLSIINEQNNILKAYYKYIEDALLDEGLNIIEEIPCHASTKHKWGLDPFHYEDKYYDELIKEINIITDFK